SMAFPRRRSATRQRGAYSRVALQHRAHDNLRVANDAAGGLARGCTKEIVMPVQKDFKRLVRDRMAKTGESYTAARQQLLKKHEPALDYAARAGMSDAAIATKTGRSWADWVRVLDRERAADKPHREIARFVS